MSIVSCPRCGDKVSVPPQAPASALVQCPLCCEEYFLSDALIQLPPMLVVVSRHVAAPEQHADERLAQPVAAAVSSAEFDTSVAAGPSRPQLRTVARPRRPEKSAVGEIVKVVLGGAAGLAGGLLVLWWLFGVDVGDLGPKLSKVAYLRYLVPEKLWDQSVRSEKEDAQLEPASALKQAQETGKAATGTSGAGQVASDSSSGDGATAGGTGDDLPEKNAKQADPFLTLDDLKTDSAPAPTGTGDLPLDDPLSAVTPKKSEAPANGDEADPDQPATAKGPSEGKRADSDKPKGEDDAKGKDEKPAEKPAAEKAEKDDKPEKAKDGTKEPTSAEPATPAPADRPPQPQ